MSYFDVWKLWILRSGEGQVSLVCKNRRATLGPPFVNELPRDPWPLARNCRQQCVHAGAIGDANRCSFRCARRIK
jgi:hypothetical protein